MYDKKEDRYVSTVGTLMILVIIFLPCIITGLIYAGMLVQDIKNKGGNPNPEWFAAFLGVILSPLIVAGLTKTNILFVIPYALYYVMIVYAYVKLSENGGIFGRIYKNIKESWKFVKRIHHFTRGEEVKENENGDA